MAKGLTVHGNYHLNLRKIATAALVFAPLLLANSCQVEQPELRQESTNNSQTEKKIVEAVGVKLRQSAPAFGLIQSFASMSAPNPTELANTQLIADLDNNELVNDAGTLTAYDEETGEFTYNIASETSFEVSGQGDKLDINLTGNVQEELGEVKVFRTELTANLTRNSRTQTFRIMHESNDSGPNTTEIHINVEVRELVRLYQALRTKKEIQEIGELTSTNGVIVVRVDDTSTTIEGQEVNIEGTNYVTDFSTMYLKFDNSNSNQNQITLDGTVTELKTSEVVGVVNIESNGTSNSRTLVIKIDI